MKTFSTLAFLLAIGILAGSIYENQYHCLPFAIMSGMLGWAMWPEKKKKVGRSGQIILGKTTKVKDINR